MSLDESISCSVPRDSSMWSWGEDVKQTVICADTVFKMGEETEEKVLNNIKVFLRLKPSTSGESPYVVLNSTTLQSEAPKESLCFKNFNNNIGKLVNKFTFTSILNEEATQGELFNKCAKENLKKFLKDGESYVLLAYGTTSAGKTFTMQGDVERPGVIPRALDFVFNSLKDYIIPGCVYQPSQFNELLALNDETSKKNLLHKNFILNLDLTKFQKYPDCSHIFSQTSSSEFSDMFENMTFKEMQTKLMDIETFELSSDSYKYSVWISMIEIYNEQVYDLLELPNDKKTRPKLTLKCDEFGNIFVKGLRYVNVATGHEAFQFFQFGRRNLHIAPTALNERSSRSHCIFTITIAKFLEYDSSSQAIVSRFSFCDLAGMERAKKTLNAKERLMESKSINTSLSIFVKCLMTIKKNQNSKEKQIIPYRESKLTKLFRDAMIGKEKLSLIVNVSSDPNMFDETINVLKFSSLAQEIISQNFFNKPKITRVRSKSRFSKIVVGSPYMDSAIDWINEIATENKENEQDGVTVAGLRDLIKSLKEEIFRERKLREEIEEKIREELTSQFSETIKRQYELHKERLENETESIQEMYERRQTRIITYFKMFYKKKRKRCEDDNDLSDDDHKEHTEKLKELESKVEESNLENQILKEQVEKLIEENKKFRSECVELKFKIVEKDKLMDNIRRTNDADGDVLELKNRLEKANENIHELKVLLNEAAVDHKELEKYNQYLDDEIEVLEEQLTQNSETISNLSEMKEFLEGKCGNLENEVKILQKKIKNLTSTKKEKITDEENSIVKEKIIDEENCKIKEEAEEYSKLKEKISQLQKEANNKEMEIKKLNTSHAEELSNLNDVLKQLQKDIEDKKIECQAEVKKQVEEVSNLNKKIIQLRTVKESKEKSLKEEASRHTEEVTKLKEIIGQLEKDIKEKETKKKEEVEGYSEEMTKLNEKINKLRNEIEAKEEVEKEQDEKKNQNCLKADYTPERLTQQIEALSITKQTRQCKSMRKKVDLLESTIHPSSAKKSASKTRSKRTKKKEETEKTESCEKENISEMKQKCHKQLFTENDFDGLTSLNVSPLEEKMTRLRPRK